MITKNWDEKYFQQDIVIIGSGPAGLSIAMDLEENGLSSLVLEAGSESYSEKSQKYYEGTISGAHYPLQSARLRQLGGSTGHWGGYCTPMYDTDFSEWPIKKSDIDNYLDKSCKLLDIEPSWINL